MDRQPVGPRLTGRQHYVVASAPNRLDFYESDHPLNDEERVDKNAWWVEQLGLGGLATQ